MNKKYKIGYTSGVFDLFHVGHLNILKRAKQQCEYLIVGVSTDQLVVELKGKFPIIPYEQRVKIIESIKYIDEVVEENNVDKFEAWNKLHYDVLFKGSDAELKDSYKEYERKLSKVGGIIVYFPYTREVSSSKIKRAIIEEKTIERKGQ